MFYDECGDIFTNSQNFVYHYFKMRDDGVALLSILVKNKLWNMESLFLSTICISVVSFSFLYFRKQIKLDLINDVLLKIGVIYLELYTFCRESWTVHIF